MPAPASSEFVPREGSVKVSVLVTSFNHERYIRTALDSVFAQQVSFPFEVVICDDASGDGTRAILAEIEARHGDRVRLLLPEKNLGHRGSEIFLRGLEMCAGEYIAPLDGDDCWTDVRKLQVQAGFLDRTPDCPLCFHNSLVQYEDGQSEPWTLYPAPLKERMDIENLLETASVHKSTLMFRREVVSDFREWCQALGLDALSDWSMALVAARRAPVGYVDGVMAVYLQHAAGEWAGVGTAEQLSMVIDRYQEMDRFLEGRYHEQIEKAVCVRSYEAAMQFEQLGDLDSASRSLARCLAGRPDWLEDYCPAHGLKCDALWENLTQRLQLYRDPDFFRLWSWIQWAAARCRWLRVMTRAKVQSHRRLARGLAVGFIDASPNPAPAGARSPALAATTVRWTSMGTDAVEVRVGMPDGPLLSRSSPSGTQATGEWVADGMVLYLQNVSRELPLTLANTLDLVRVRVKKRTARPLPA